ncbi:DDE_3 domain-containing protein [Trichonephila clavipes]|nr:DDE_3 domain-containing protein [Trichonephila clavipes]
MRSSLRFNKFITPKTIESSLWTLQAPLAIGEHRKYPKSIIVWDGISASGKTPLVFVEEGVKINQKVYQRYILEAVVLPWAQKHFGKTNWTFQ